MDTHILSFFSGKQSRSDGNMAIVAHVQVKILKTEPRRSLCLLEGVNSLCLSNLHLFSTLAAHLLHCSAVAAKTSMTATECFHAQLHWETLACVRLEKDCPGFGRRQLIRSH